MDKMKVHREVSPRDRIDRWANLGERFLQEHSTVESCWKQLINPRHGATTKAFALASLLINTFPRARKTVLSALERKPDFSEVPISPDLYEFRDRIGLGYVSEVYFLAAKQDDLPNLVLKVEYPKTKKDLTHLTDLTKRYQEEYAFWKEAYRELPNLIPDTQYLITKSPRTKNPAIAVVQTFIGHDTFDPLASGNKEKIETLLQSDSHFKEEFERFRTITLQLHESGEAPDIAGGGNVLVVENDDTHALRLVDTHGFSAGNAQQQKVQEKTIQHLREIGTR